MFSITLSTFKEVYRKKIVHVVGILTILYLILLGVISSLIAKNSGGDIELLNTFLRFSSMISILGFYFSSMLVAFLTVMLSIGVISSELESGTILTIITKPIKRREYVLGKYLGTAALIALYSAILYIAVIFLSALSKISLIETFGLFTMIKGFILFVFEPLTILALSIWGSTIFKTLNNGIFVIAIYILGIIGGVMEQIGAIMNKESLTTLGIIASLISPFDIIYKKMISTIFSSVGGFNIFGGFSMLGKSTEPSIWMMVYACFYLVFFIIMAIRGFEKKDIG